jgi:alpha-glucosidase
MHPAITPHVRDLIKLRYRLMPYLYDLLWRYHRDYEPMVRPTFFDFPDDLRCYNANDEMMVGPALLAAPVVEPGRDTRMLDLPSGADWYDVWSGKLFAGGERVTLPAPRTRPVLLGRAGHAIALNVAEQHFAKPADARGFQIFPYPGRGAFTATSFEDDGESYAYLSGAFRQWTLVVDCGERLHIALDQSGGLPRSGGVVQLVLPATETRAISLSGATLVGETRSPDGRVGVAMLQT